MPQAWSASSVDLAPGASATVQLTGIVSAYAISGTLLLNAVQVGSSNVDADPANNTASAATAVDNRALLTIDKEAAVTTVAPGGSLAYRIAVHNGGPSLARTVVMTDLLPVQLLNPLLSSSRGSCGATACSLGDLPPGDTVTILVMGIASPFATGSIENRAVSPPLRRWIPTVYLQTLLLFWWVTRPTCCWSRRPCRRSMPGRRSPIS